MSTRLYTLPTDLTGWNIPGQSSTVFSWDYDGGRERLLNLYEKGKQRQWDAVNRIDWTREIDLENPLAVPDESCPIYGSKVWDSLNLQERATVRQHLVAWQFSQFLHGEQGALICSSKIVQTVPDVDAKFYAATQVMDEARHVEIYSRFLREKLGLAYPINPQLRALLNDVVADQRWDMTYLGMQVLIEGLALAAFSLIRDMTGEPLAQALNAYVMQDEARHVAFGRLALREYYPQLTQAEREEREEFCVEACLLMNDRFLGEEIWRHLDFDTDECVRFMKSSSFNREFRSFLFSRIVPTLRDIGLLGPKVRHAFGKMGVLGFEEHNIDDLMARDEQIAADFDNARAGEVESIIALGDS
jgi:P-aminobenzoate N-oxygenase AurF